ncbi:MAG TPA: hypothetical protein VN704_02200 [Verrucomicrobiae bacterium]|nr:hypothetical protein [Verrucomicrobiae bacterium]
MGRTIPSFRILIDIEKASWLSFRKCLNNKDKKIFDILFNVPKLYCHSLSNLSKSTIIEPIILINLFHNFKLIKIKQNALTIKIETKENKNDFSKQKTEDEFQIFKLSQLQLHERKEKKQQQWYGKDTSNNNNNNNQFIKDWKKFSDCLTSDDKSIFIEMINDCYINYNKSINANIKEKDTNSCLTRIISLFMALILYQQKQINLIKANQRFVN